MLIDGGVSSSSSQTVQEWSKHSTSDARCSTQIKQRLSGGVDGSWCFCVSKKDVGRLETRGIKTKHKIKDAGEIDGYQCSQQALVRRKEKLEEQ